MGWLKAAPRFYFLGDKSAMPPQGHMNTGQKMWFLLAIIFGTAFVITGLIMWFGKTTLAPSVLLWTVFLHDIAFIVTGVMLFVHIYLGVLHPMMTESWRAMAKGKISSEYAKTHHAKWYEEVTKRKGVES
jgi:formate dehydrogenase subunit gamma